MSALATDVWTYINETGNIIGSANFGSTVPKEYADTIQRFVEAKEAQQAILFVYYDNDKLVIENQLSKTPTLKVDAPPSAPEKEDQNVLEGEEKQEDDALAASPSPDTQLSDDDENKQKVSAPEPAKQQDTGVKEPSIFFFINSAIMNTGAPKAEGEESQQFDIKKTIQAGVITPQVIDELLNVMTTVIQPWVKQVTSWPVSVKDEFLNQLERYLSSVTEVSNLQRGHTVLYIPVFEDVNPQESSRNKDVIPRLETLVVHWTRQIKELISGIHQGQGSGQDERANNLRGDDGYAEFPLLQNPLTEIEYWRRRNDDLQQVINQLKSPSLINIIQTLKYAQSHYAQQFEALETELQEKTDEASKNLEDLQQIEALCEKLTNAVRPHEVYEVIKPLLDQIVIISKNSAYYSIQSNLSNLLRRVANAVVNSCATYISLKDIFEKDTLLSLKKLGDCKDLINYFKELYQELSQSGAWEDDNSVVASCDAFSQRCVDLIEVCQDRLQFQRPKTLLDCKDGLLERVKKLPNTGNQQQDNFTQYMIQVLEQVGHFYGDPEDKREGKRDEYEDGEYFMPKFSGAQGETVRKSVREMQESYKQILKRVMSVPYNHLDVRASRWHEDVAQYRQDVKDLTIFAENIVKNSFATVQNNVIESCNVLSAFDHLASRTALRSAVSKKISETIRAFIEKVNQLKTQFETLKASQSQEGRQIPLSCVLAHQCFMPQKGSMAISIKRLVVQLDSDWNNLLPWLHPRAKQAASDAISRQRFNNQQQTTLNLPADCGKDEYEAVDIYVRTKVIFESNIERTYQDWKGQTESLNPAQTLEKEVIAYEPSVKFQEFLNTVDMVTNRLNLSLLQNRLVCNASQEVNTCMQEHFVFADYFGFKAPQNSQELYFKRQRLHLNEMLVQSCVNEVNQVIDYLQPGDVQLFKQRLSKLADKIQPLFINKGWENVNLPLEIAKIRTMAVEDLKMISLYYDNKRKIDDCIKELLNINLFQVRKTAAQGGQQKQLLQPLSLQEFVDMQVVVREDAVKDINNIFDQTIQALVACYDIFRADGDEIQQEWIRHVQTIDDKIEQTVLEMYYKSYSDFAMAITGRRIKPDPQEQYNGSGGEPIFHMTLQLEKGGKGPEIVPSLEELKTQMNIILKQSVYEIIPKIQRLSKSLVEQETILKEKNIKLKEQKAQEMILKAENEGLPLTDQAKAEIFAEVEMWKNISIPQYIVKGEYFEMFTFLDKLFQGGDREPSKSLPKVKVDIYQSIRWIRDYVAECCNQCHNSLNQYQIYKDCWLENPTQYYQQHYKQLLDLNVFKNTIQHFIDLIDKLQVADNHYSIQINFMDANQLIKEINNRANQFRKNLQDALLNSMTTDLSNHSQKLQEIIEQLARASENVDQLKEQIIYFDQAKQYMAKLEETDTAILNKIIALKEFDVECQQQEELFQKVKTQLGQAANLAIQQATIQIQKEKNKYKDIIQVDINQLQRDTKALRELIEETGPFANNIESKEADQMTQNDITAAFRQLRDFREDTQRLQTRMEQIEENQRGFTDNFISDKELKQIDVLLALLEKIWEFAKVWNQFVTEKGVKQLMQLDQGELQQFQSAKEMELRKLMLSTAGGYEPKGYQVCKYLQKQLEMFKPIPNLVVDLQNKSMRGRHWTQITEKTKIHIEIINPETEAVEQYNLDPNNKHFTLQFIVDKQMSQFADDINQISGGATQEEYIEKSVQAIEDRWYSIEYSAQPYQSKGFGGGGGQSTAQHYILRGTEDVFQALEESTLSISALKGSKFAKAHEFKLDCWENLLGQIQESTELILQAQSAWMYLESIFAASDDIRKQLPNESIQFDEANESWRRNLTNIYRSKKVLFVLDVTEVTSPKLRLSKTSNLVKSMVTIIQTLDQVQKQLESYLERKRAQFPRFYFLSNDELLEILAQSRNPLAVQPHIKKCFDGMKELDMQEKKGVIMAHGIFGQCSECVPFLNAVNCNQTVETWLTAIESMMKVTLQDMVMRCYSDFIADKLQLPLLLGKWPGQLCVVAQQLRWTDQVQNALSSGKQPKQSGDEEVQLTPEQLDELKAENLQTVRKALKGARKRSVMFLQRLTEIFQGYPDIFKQLKEKINLNDYQLKNFDPKLVSNKTRAQITLEIHNRDIIDQLYHAKISEPSAFEWFSQLKFYVEAGTPPADGEGEAKARIVIRQTEAALDYQYEYCNNSGRLVITPLTDRCYITITSSVLIQKGTLPQGPAGTGKTETVKDLSKALAVLCVIFNCSDGLDYKSLGRLFSGLCQCGAWSCFDEFNRLLPDVLSVVAQQINVILQAISAKLERFVFEGNEIPLNPFCYINITMNPGYAGRSELPENLQQLFRPISMVTPNFNLIIEVSIQSEGFRQARMLGQKLTSLFSLCNLQLSKQTHYDWTLRSLKAILVAAGSLKRQDPNQQEDQILMRAMSFSTEPKLIKSDLPLFKGLVADLFPGLEFSELHYGLLEAAIDLEFCVRKLFYNVKQKEKVLQLYEAKLARHGVMLIGRSGGGKTLCYEILCAAMVRCYQAMIESCDPAKRFKNPYCALLNSVCIEKKEFTNLGYMLRSVYNDQSGNDKVLAEKNHFVKCIYYMRDIMKEMADSSFKTQLTEPVYDAKVACLHDKQFSVTIKFMNPKSLTANQMYGSLDPATNEWVDGIVSNILRQSSKDSQMGYLFGGYDQSKLNELVDKMNPENAKFDAMKEITKYNNFWVMYDGPVDTLWIETQNSVLDDSKVLTLVNGERISFPNQVSMLFEANDLDVASPATVSRCGQCYFDLNDIDYVWQYEQWIEFKFRQAKKVPNIAPEVQTIVIDVLETFGMKVLKKLFEQKEQGMMPQIIPQADYAVVRMFITLFETMATDFNGLKLVGEDNQVPRMVEMIVIYCATQAFGGSLTPEGRKNLDIAIRELESQMPSSDAVFDYRVDLVKKQWSHWGDSLSRSWRPAPGVPLFSCLVPTVDTIKSEYMLKTMILAQNLQYCRQANYKGLAGTNFYQTNIGTMFFGVSGAGKTGLVKNQIIPALEQTDISNCPFSAFQNVVLKTANSCDVEVFYVDGKLGKYTSVQLGLSAQTTPDRLRIVVESRLQATATSLAPKGKRLLAYLDDFNMPQYDEFGSQPCLEIVKQYIERGSWYRQRKDKFYLSNVQDVDILAAMATPGGGRNQISGRILSKFNIIAVDTPSDSVLRSIFTTLLNIHFQKFDESIKALIEPSVTAGIDMFNQISTTLLPTPIKPFYEFNLRDLSKFYSGIMRATQQVKTPEQFAKLWTHECMRVYYDRMITVDKPWFMQILEQKIGQAFDLPIGKVFTNKQAPIFVDFLNQELINIKMSEDDENGVDKIVGVYEEVLDIPALKQNVEGRLQDYNQSGAAVMDLVMFQDALEHVCKICRILSQPQGHALLIGTGGTGRQSMARMAAFLENQVVFVIEVGKNYKQQNFRDDIKKLFMQAGGAEQKASTLLLTDNQISDESFLEDINSLLSSGEIPGLFNNEDLQQIADNLSPVCKQMKISETIDSCYQLLIRRAKENLHIVLCFSPSHEKFRERLRMYPGLLSSCTIDLFGEWPLTALDEVANYFLGKFEDLREYTKEDLEVQKAKPQDPNLPKTDPIPLTQRLSKVFTKVHDAANQASTTMAQQSGRFLFVTPANYLSFVRLYCQVFIQQRDKIQNNINKYSGGVKQLIQAQEDVTVMRAELEVKKTEVMAKKELSDKLLIQVNAQQQEANEKQKRCEEDKAKLSVVEADLLEKTKEADYKLSLALPQYEQAQEALNGLKDSAIQEVQGYKQYTKGVLLTLQAVMVLLRKPQTQESIKAELSKSGFLQSLKQYDYKGITNAQQEQLKKFYTHEDFVPRTIEAASLPCKCICVWVIALYEFTNIWRVVKPLQENAERMKQELQKAQEILAEKERELAELMAKIKQLEIEFNKAQETLQQLQKEEEFLSNKLERANSLVTSLQGERTRWLASIDRLKIDLGKIPGDCVIATAFLCYSGALSGKFRAEIMKSWIGYIYEQEIPTSVTEQFNVASYLVDPAVQYTWTVQGLPSDNFSAENGVLITQSNKQPYIIDPQKQAIRWLKRMLEQDEKTRENFKILNVKEPNYLQQIELAVKYGSTVILEDVTENIDPSLDPIITKQVIKKGGAYVIKIKDKEIEYNDNFRIYLCTRINNPKLSPELFAKTTIVNFSLVHEGLSDQLLACVVLKENKALEEKKAFFVTSTAAKKQQIIQLENEILDQLANSTTNLLDNEPLQKALEQSKQTSDEVTKELETFAVMERKIDTLRGGYRPIAERASMLFFIMQDLSNIDFMYQFSLDSYIKLFNNSIDNSQPHEDISHRIKIINDYHTYAVYKYCCRGLFTRHKVLLSLHMCVKILEFQNKINIEEYMFLLRGGQIFDKSQQPANPAPEWISAIMWDNLCCLDKMGVFRGIVPQFEQRVNEWKNQYFIVNEPETAQLVGELDSTLDELQKMLVLRCMRPDRLIHAINNYVKNNLNTPQYNFTAPPPFDLKQALLDSSPTTPIIFILSQGTDPTAILQQFAKDCKMGDRLLSVALGQGQQEIATKAFKEGVKNGKWVMLANVHLSTDWLIQLEKMMEDLTVSQTPPHKDFRLWLSTFATPKFPIGLLQNSIKITTEAPSGIRANLLQAYGNISDGLLSTFAKADEEAAQQPCDPSNPQSLTFEQKDAAFRKLVFSTSFFYALLVERRKFGTLGFNIKYPFSQADFQTALELLKQYLAKYNTMPWQAIRYIVAQIVFGGRVIDDLDRRVLICYIEDLFNDDVINEQQYMLSNESEAYYVPPKGSLYEYREYIKSLPTGSDIADVFGQHNNADIFSRNIESQELLQTILTISQFNEGGDENKEEGKEKKEAEEEQQKGGQQLSAREARIIQMAQEIGLSLPAELTNLPTKIIPEDPNAPLLSVLLQESERYAKLREQIFNDMQQVQKGIKGLIGMSQHLDNIANCLYQNIVPASWSISYKSTKSLAPWSRDFKRRVEQIQGWANNGHPKCMWLGGLAVPTCYLTSLLQQASRKTSIAIDNLEWGFEVTMWTDPAREINDAQVPKLGEGVLVYDMFLEGAGWHMDNRCLKDSTPMELYVPMPVIKFIPLKQYKKGAKYKAAFYECPVYFYPVRTGSREQPSFMLNAWLHVGQNTPEFYIKRGTALLMNLGD